MECVLLWKQSHLHCIKGEELMGIIKCSEEFTLYFTLIPSISNFRLSWWCIGDKIPAGGIGTVFSMVSNGSTTLPRRFAHLLPFLSARVRLYDSFVSHWVKHQDIIVKEYRTSSCLVDTFGDEICWEGLFECLFVLKRKMPLCIRR